MQTPLLMSGQAMADMLFYADHAPNNCEINGLGRIQNDNFGIPYVSEVVILPQEVTGAHANISVEEIEKFYDSKPEEERAEWCFQWHSHVNMGTGPSGTDENDWNGLIQLIPNLTVMIINRQRQYTARQYCRFPVTGHFPITKIWPIEAKKYRKEFPTLRDSKEPFPELISIAEMASGEQYWTKDRQDWIKSEIAEKVKERKVVTAQQQVGFTRTITNTPAMQKNSATGTVITTMSQGSGKITTNTDYRQQATQKLVWTKNEPKAAISNDDFEEVLENILKYPPRVKMSREESFLFDFEDKQYELWWHTKNKDWVIAMTGNYNNYAYLNKVAKMGETKFAYRLFAHGFECYNRIMFEHMNKEEKISEAFSEMTRAKAGVKVVDIIDNYAESCYGMLWSTEANGYIDANDDENTPVDFGDMMECYYMGERIYG